MKRLLVFAITLFIISKAHSQDTTVVAKPAPVPVPAPAPKPVSSESDMDNKFNFGLSLTPSINWFNVSSDNIKSDGSKFGFSYGLVGEYSIAQRYAFSTGIDIAYRGGKITSNSTDTVSKANWKINYVGLPLSLKMRTNQIGKFAYFGQFGAVLEFNTGAKVEYEYANGTSEKLSSEKSSITDFNFTFRVGAGLEYYLHESTRMFGGITWNQGLIDVFTDDGNDAKNNYVALQIGVFF